MDVFLRAAGDWGEGDVVSGRRRGAGGQVAPVPREAADRLARVRERLRASVYESDAVRFLIARRILASGDL